MPLPVVTPFGSVISRVTYRQRLAMLSCLVGAVGFSVAASDAKAAQAATSNAKKATASSSHVASAKQAAPAKKPASSLQARGVEEISVGSSRRQRSGGGGMMRVETAPHSVQTVTKEYIETRSPVSTALDLVQMMPSMSITSPDTSGMQGGQVQSRGFTDRDMGIMLDDVNTGQAKYLAEIIDSENVEEVSITPGSASRELPVVSAAAGIVNSRSYLPSHKMGGVTDFSYGTNNLSRQFIRLESGDIGNTGVRGYFSFSHAHARR